MPILGHVVSERFSCYNPIFLNFLTSLLVYKGWSAIEIEQSRSGFIWRDVHAQPSRDHQTVPPNEHTYESLHHVSQQFPFSFFRTLTSSNAQTQYYSIIVNGNLLFFFTFVSFYTPTPQSLPAVFSIQNGMSHINSYFIVVYLFHLHLLFGSIINV